MSLRLARSIWKRVALGDVVRHVTDRVDAETSGLEWFLAGEHIPSGSLAITERGRIGRDPVGPMFYKRFRPGHVLYVSRRTYLRKVAVPEFEGITGEKTFVLETIDSHALLQDLLPFVLSSERFHSYAIANSRGSVNPYLNWGELAAYEFELPPLDEQQRLADLLWKVERHRAASDPRALRGVESHLLERLLHLDARGVRVSDLGDVLLGRQRAPEHADGINMVPYLRVANVGDDHLKLNDVKCMNFTPEEQSRYRVLPGDILLSEGQSRELVGQSALIDELPQSMCFQNTLIRFRAMPDFILPAYAQKLFRACLKQGVFADVATQTTSIAHLGVKRFASLVMPVPPIQEQGRHLERLSLVGRGIATAETELSSLTGLRSSLLAEIFGDR